MLRKVWNTAKKHIDLCAFALITGIAVIDLLRYAALGMLQPLLYMVVTELILVSFAFAAWKGKLPILMLPVGLAVGWLGTWTSRRCDSLGAGWHCAGAASYKAGRAALVGVSGVAAGADRRLHGRVQSQL